MSGWTGEESCGRLPDAEQVVDQAVEEELGVDGLEAPPDELPETAAVFDLGEGGLGQVGSSTVEPTVVRVGQTGLEAVADQGRFRWWGRAATTGNRDGLDASRPPGVAHH